MVYIRALKSLFKEIKGEFYEIVKNIYYWTSKILSERSKRIEDDEGIRGNEWV